MSCSPPNLNDAELTGTATELNIYSIMGACEVRIPHGADVQVSTFALMGGNDVNWATRSLRRARRQFTYD